MAMIKPILTSSVLNKIFESLKISSINIKYDVFKHSMKLTSDKWF